MTQPSNVKCNVQLTTSICPDCGKQPVSLSDLHFPLCSTCRAERAASWLRQTFLGRAIAQ